MIRQPISSSMILSVGYDEQTQTLEVQFSSGSVYQYHDVPEDVWDSFINSSSVGRTFLSDIKGQFEGVRV